jgi:hypothetical protein
MGSTGPHLKTETFERLREQLATASALCSNDQLLELADGLHETIRRRRARRPQAERSAPGGREGLCLSANWPKWLTAAPLDRRSFNP